MRHRVRAGAAIAVGVVLMAFFLRSAELDRVASAIATARRDLLLAAFVWSTLTYVVRVVRWRVLLAPLGAVGFGITLRATIIGFAVTALLPGRVGEVLRPYVLARHERLSTSAVFATVVVERLLDLVAILIVFGLSVVAFDPRFALTDGTLLGAMRVGAGLAAVAAVLTCGIACVAAGHPERVGRGVGRLTASFPGRLSGTLARVSQRFVDGLAVMRRPGPLVWSLVWSLVLWLLIAAALWNVSVAFGIDMPPAGAGTLLVLVALGVAVPTPAGIGGYHAAYQVGATGLYGAAAEASVGAGLMAHALSFLPVTIVGVVLMMREGIRLSRIGQMVADAGGAEPEPEASGAPAAIRAVPRVEFDDKGGLG